MNKKLETLLLLAVRRSGTYDPYDALLYIEESLTGLEYTLADRFLSWVNDHANMGFGPTNIQARFSEFKKAVR